MAFHDFMSRLVENFKERTDGKELFEVGADKDRLWDLYLRSFPAPANPIYRVRTEHDCSCCRQFIREAGRIVWIDDDFTIHNIFEFDAHDADYQIVINALNEYVRTCSIVGKYLYEKKIIGTPVSRERLDDGTVVSYEHFSMELPDVAVFRETHRTTIDTERGRFRDRKNVFQRSLDEISIDAIKTVQELIQTNTLYKGSEWADLIDRFLQHKIAYDSLRGASRGKRTAYCWANASGAGDALGKIRNHSIGTLLVDISEGVELDEAVRRYEAIVAPANYKRPKAVYSKRMLEDAQRTVTELGYMDSLPRRFATLDDITVNDILFSNKDSAKRISGNVFDEMKQEAAVDPKKFSRVQEVSMNQFVRDILPDAKEVEALTENRLAPNMVSLIAPVNKDAKSMFKWSNGFSWAYSGNITDSDIRENVKLAGGKVEGALRFSIQWNDVHTDLNDLDAHCKITFDDHSTGHIYFASKVNWATGGNLDVDIINPAPGKPAVENIIFPNKKFLENRLKSMALFVHCYTDRGGKDGFRAEIEYDGQIHSYDYRKPLRHDEIVQVANLQRGIDGTYSLRDILPSCVASRELWGVKTQTFVPVTTVMASPNWWNSEEGVGHKHWFFMLKDCVNPEKPNGFYNEFLKQELVEHKRVFEALGSKMAVQDTNDQLSGLGFSDTKRNNLIVKVRSVNNTERIYNIKF